MNERTKLGSSRLTDATCQSCRVRCIWRLVVKGIVLRVCPICDLGYVENKKETAA